ncbi:MAG TPA: hypothetical protein VIL46_16130 [Gemmataceae bacterium]
MREFSVDLTARLPAPPGNSREEAAERASELLSALEDDARALGPVTWGHFDPPILGARFNVEAPDAGVALERAKDIFTDALRTIGYQAPPDLIEIQVEVVDPDGVAASEVWVEPVSV